jgi:DNA-binding response OmpR family regulator
VFLLAANNGDVRALPEPPIEPAAEIAAVGTILVIDDEEVVRKLARAALERAGYQVLDAADGATGLAILEEHKNAISLVLLDMGMPEMSGRTVLTKIRETGISVPVAICSGYGESEVSRQLADCDFIAVIHKPFNAAELLKRVRAALRSDASAA